MMSTKRDTTSDHLLSMAPELRMVAAESDLTAGEREAIGIAKDSLARIAARRERPVVTTLIVPKAAEVKVRGGF
jgi:hypothetical protein